ncbi:MAG: hypothetical protein IJ172_02660 [Ruminococcus sp.]|nr:hypothetical protein [Ruminococcus sp.]
MSMGRLTAVLLAAVICCAALTACGSPSADSVSAQTGKAQENTVTYDTTVFTVCAPSGWCAAPAPDTLKEYDGKTNPDQVYVIKNGKSADDIMKYPYIWISYYQNAERFVSPESMYSDSRKTTVDINGTTWEGFTYTSSGYPGACITLREGESLWVAMFVLSHGEYNIDLNEQDVKTVLSSLKIKQ